MKIHNIPGIMKAYNQKKVHSVKKTENIGRKDEMLISNHAQIMSKVMQKVKDTPEIREEKVLEIKQQIRQGTYSVQAEQVADEIIKGVLLSKRG